MQFIVLVSQYLMSDCSAVSFPFFFPFLYLYVAIFYSVSVCVFGFVRVYEPIPQFSLIAFCSDWARSWLVCVRFVRPFLSSFCLFQWLLNQLPSLESIWGSVAWCCLAMLGSWYRLGDVWAVTALSKRDYLSSVVRAEKKSGLFLTFSAFSPSHLVGFFSFNVAE